MKKLGRIFRQRVLTSMLILIAVSLLIGSVVERVDAGQIGTPAIFTGGSSIAAENKQSNNVGISCANTVSYVSGHKFDDNTQIGLPAWRIRLIGYDPCNGGIVNMVTITNSTGYYQFAVPNIPASNAQYLVLESLQRGWVPCCSKNIVAPILPSPGLPPGPPSSIYDFRNKIW